MVLLGISYEHLYIVHNSRYYSYQYYNDNEVSASAVAPRCVISFATSNSRYELPRRPKLPSTPSVVVVRLVAYGSDTCT